MDLLHLLLFLGAIVGPALASRYLLMEASHQKHKVTQACQSNFTYMKSTLL